MSVCTDYTLTDQIIQMLIIWNDILNFNIVNHMLSKDI